MLLLLLPEESQDHQGDSATDQIGSLSDALLSGRLPLPLNQVGISREYRYETYLLIAGSQLGSERLLQGRVLLPHIHHAELLHCHVGPLVHFQHCRRFPPDQGAKLQGKNSHLQGKQDWINQYYNRVNKYCHKTAMKAFRSYHCVKPFQR